MAAKITPASRTVLDMTAARSQASIDVPRVRNYVYGGQDMWDRNTKFVKAMENDPVFDKSERVYMSRTERYKRAIKLTHRFYELQDIHGWSNEEAARAFVLIDEDLPMHLSSATFEPVFMDQCGPYLRAKYGELVANRGIQGCYMQTELGHGTDVGSLETTATYIPETKEFEIHSPTLTSSKWWIGALGKTATHGIVQAKLILPGGKDMGPHMFFVQLRSLKDHTLLPGRTVGDIGPKVFGGYITVDNGYARFDHVRIPREYMLSEYSQVTEDGQYVKPLHAKLSYGGMLWVRAALVGKGGMFIAKAATIAIRYCTVRRQSNKGPDGLERSVISYPSVHYRLLPVLAHAYAFLLLGRDLNERVRIMGTQLAVGDASMVPEMHLTSSALKILVTSLGVQDIETVRRAMGGHGFSAYSGLGRLYADWLPTATYEGDNYVLDMQVVRGALKSLRNLQSSKSKSSVVSSLPQSSAFVRFILPEYASVAAAQALNWSDPKISIVLLERRAAAMVQNRATHERDPDASMDNRVSRSAAEAYFGVRIGEFIEGLGKTLKPHEAEIVGKMFTLGLLTLVEGGLVDILAFGLLPASKGEDPARGLRMAIKEHCAALLPEVIGLTDAFGFTDWQLDSALGVYDGNVYEGMWKKAQTEPLNATEVVDGYKEYIKPMLERGQRIVASASKAKL
ncbi:acyl-CoA oxidase [Laetiporus sulphureus 93-53]|uniref:Acyl-coenzyme A oxidase n=1 Tax=Laetiporus sulphureus 93-53 TaxID=1314785 RepID=A0A165BAF5_9APHY|nr:acyl-CoA oxidase [Laetiporus sulphureus 93-53]KZT00615.1 acyl-CoA oxidase [Laetiporus sulphureus 93-53]